MHLVLAFLFMVAACGGEAKTKSGSERGPCYGNGTCDDGLSCLSETCVQAPGSASVVDQNLGALRAEMRDMEERVSRLEADRSITPATPEASLELLDKASPPRPRTTSRTRTEIPDLVNPFDEEAGDTVKNPFESKDPCRKNPNLPECMLD